MFILSRTDRFNVSLSPIEADQHGPQSTQRDQHRLFGPDRVRALIWAHIQVHIEKRLCVFAAEIWIVADHVLETRNSTEDYQQMPDRRSQQSDTCSDHASRSTHGKMDRFSTGKPAR
jgi:hypothetical protein